ncbi:polyprenyl synthetase family protein [Aestuariimicrobium soli]|uniref:polyprenyl synthetase family protein n=1 Tax=Aestuariimicrobium soli TaxID=2035834 RepID=UPI003EB862A8
MASFDPSTPLSDDFREAIHQSLATFIERRSADLVQIAAPLSRLGELATTFTSGGKRMRPAFVYWSHVAAGGQPDDPEPLLRASASVDLLHVSALMHDDVMDGSDTRRGVPSAHRQLEAEHQAATGRGSAEAFGRAGAILLGDLLLVWSAELFSSSGMPHDALTRSQPLLDAVRHEVTAGQYLDVLAQARLGVEPGNSSDLAQEVALAERVVEFKTSRYTVVRPCQIGAALGGGSQELVQGLGQFGSPLGHAFQYRDDVLGVFGDEEVTGKPAGDDLREGKRTVLVAHALALASPTDGAELDAMLGDASLTANDIDRARAIIEGSGALAATERAIAGAYEKAMAALSSTPMTDEGRQALTALAEASVRRQS